MLKCIVLLFSLFAVLIQCQVNVEFFYDIYGQEDLTLSRKLLNVLNSTNSVLKLMPYADNEVDQRSLLIPCFDHSMNLTMFKLQKCIVLSSRIDSIEKLKTFNCTMTNYDNNGTNTLNILSECISDAFILDDISVCWGKCIEPIHFNEYFTISRKMITKFPTVRFDDVSMEAYRVDYLDDFEEFFQLYYKRMERLRLLNHKTPIYKRPEYMSFLLIPIIIIGLLLFRSLLMAFMK